MDVPSSSETPPRPRRADGRRPCRFVHKVRWWLETENQEARTRVNSCPLVVNNCPLVADVNSD